MRYPVPELRKIRITALEDFHTGSGTGSGDIDALLSRDRSGNPVIPGTHLKGLLREAGEELAEILADSGEQVALGTLLGKAGQGAGGLLLSAAYLDDKEFDEGDLEERDSGPNTLIWQSSAREKNGRRPEPDTLRMVEYAAARLKFTARVRVKDDDQLALLNRLLKRVDRIGGGRNRGSGLVTACLEDDALEPRDLPEQAERWLRLAIRNIDPLCLPRTGHPGNLIETQSFIRGQTLRGALISWALANGKPFAELESALVGNALPLPAHLTAVDAVIPIPLSLQSEKAVCRNTSLPWWALDQPPPRQKDMLDDSAESLTGKPKRPGEHDYLCRPEPDAPWQRYSPRISVHLRNESRDKQTDETRLFSQEEIAEQTCFQADLRFASAAQTNQFLQHFELLLQAGDYLTIGRGGRPAFIESVTTFSKHPLAVTDDGSEQGFTLTLLSDLIVRGPRLEYVDDLDVAALSRLASLAENADIQVDETKCYRDTETIAGFNAATGLRRATAHAIRRGSCWHISGSDSGRVFDGLATHAALGERTEEGFGRFALDLHPLKTTAPPPSANTTRRNIREAIRSDAKALAEDLMNAAVSNADRFLPSRSQLQWLHSQAQACGSEESLRELLDAIGKAPERRPKGGHAWKNIPVKRLEEALQKLPYLAEKQYLLSNTAQWLLILPTRNGGEH
jgi:hypothetical protein